MTNHELISSFYAAFQRRDSKKMQSLYHDNGSFQDPAFGKLDARQVRAMWEMLLRSATDLEVTFRDVESTGDSGSCKWEAVYTFSLTGRKVHNKISAEFEFKDQKIFRHVDHFNFWRWSRMALGTPGYLLGWTPFLQKKVSGTARYRLDKFMKENNL